MAKYLIDGNVLDIDNVSSSDNLHKLNGNLIEIQKKSVKDLTKIYHDEKTGFGIYNYIVVERKDESHVLGAVHFQHKPVEEIGVKGVFIEDLLEIALDKLNDYQNSEFNCDENKNAIIHIQEAIAALNKRTEDRKKRGVLDKYEK